MESSPAREAVTREYYRARKSGWSPVAAMEAARGYIALRHAEIQGHVTIAWVTDEAFDLGNFTDIPELERETRENLADGTWSADVCEVFRGEMDGNTAYPFRNAVPDASLCGIVTGCSASDETYRRSVAADLAADLGIIDLSDYSHPRLKR
jgi:hypothetical protein